MAVFDFIIDSFITKGISEGLSANAIQAALSANNLGVRRTDLLARIRELGNIPARASVLKYLPNAAKPSKANITLGGNYQTKPYLSSVDINLYNPDTGEYFTLYRKISSNTLLSAGQLKELAQGQLLDKLASSNLEVKSSYITTVFARSDIYKRL